MSTIQESPRKSSWCWRTISRRRRRTRLRTTAPPRRREVTKPTRHGPEFFTETTLSTKHLPRCARPSRLTRSYSAARVNRRLFGKQNEAPAGITDLIASDKQSDFKQRRAEPATVRWPRAGRRSSLTCGARTAEVFPRLSGKTPQEERS